MATTSRRSGSKKKRTAKTDPTKSARARNGKTKNSREQQVEHQPQATTTDRMTAPVSRNYIPAVPNANISLTTLSSAAGQVVERAAIILEQEIAAGISAAQEVEERFIDVAEIRGRDPNQLMQRYRQDVHDIVDIVLDLTTVFVDRLGVLAGTTPQVPALRRRLAAPHQRTANRPASNGGAMAGGLPVLSNGPVRAGEAMSLVISVNNDGPEEIRELNFHCSDLVSTSGKSIKASNLSVEPSPVTVSALGREQVKISVKIPKNTAPGLYSGVFQADKLSHVRAILAAEVVTAA